MTDPSQARLRGFEALIAAAGADPRARAALARLLRTDGHKARAAEVALQALAAGGDDSETRALAREVLSADVPAWHFGIVRDSVRNQAYDTALGRAVTPQSRVLEIGSGTGLLAMMAARAGAAHVYSCEMEPVIALAAREVVARNGLSDRVTILSKHSDEVTLADLGGAPADVLVQEIVSNDMVIEDALPALETAIARLVKPGGAVIPARGRVRVAYARLDRLERRQLGAIAGFDLSPFDPLAAPSFQLDVGSPHLTLCSSAADLFDFDFAGGGPWPAARAQAEVTMTGEPANGIVQWIALDMDGVGLYENAPAPGTDSCWAALFHPLAAPMHDPAGGKRAIYGAQDRASLRIWS